MSVTIQENGYSSYTVVLGGEHYILTTVTSNVNDVEQWIDDILRIHRRRVHNLLVGLDVEWRPSFGRYQNPVAVLQLCVGRRCLVFQILHAVRIPMSLRNFLGDQRFTFCGVGVAADVERLEDDHGLSLGGMMQDLRTLAAHTYGDPQLKQAGIKALTNAVMGLDIDKPKRVTMSRWDQEWLTWDQIKYACADAFLSFEIARRLNSTS